MREKIDGTTVKSPFGLWLKKLKALVMMQLKDKIDLSFVKSTRSVIIKSVLIVLKLALATTLFWALFKVCNLLTLFYPVGYIPDKAVNVIFVIIQFMAIITCSLGLTRSLYMTSDNKVLLTFPVGSTSIYVSKLILYYIFELRKNFGITLPLLIAYGLINSAAWYFYPYVLFCFLFVSLLPVAIGAVLSIVLLFCWQLIKGMKWLQFLLSTMAIAIIVTIVVETIMLIPENIDIMGQWYSITIKISDFLDSFATYLFPFYCITLMMVGGTLRIRGNLIGSDTFIYFGIMLAVIVVLLALSFAVAKPMFVWMAAKQFEFEKRKVKRHSEKDSENSAKDATAFKKNRVYNKKVSPFIETLAMNFKESSVMLSFCMQLILPAIATLLLNKIYNAMYTNYTGLVMTKTFNFLVMLVMTLSFNNVYASVYSKEGAARNLIKTRPQQPVYTLLGRIAPRGLMILLSSIGVLIAYLQFSTETAEVVLMTLVTFFTAEAHLLWCAEMDIMNSYADQFQTVGVYDSPNERKATAIGFLLAIVFAFLYYFLRDRGTLSSLIKCLAAVMIFTAVRIYLFVKRSKLYFTEK